MYFQQQRQQYSKFKSLYGQKVKQDSVSLFQQKLFDEIHWEGANVIFPMSEVGPAFPEEKAGYARRAFESSAAVVQGIG
ncbi:MAG: hypothetical protein EZS28_007397 [Streblomastix strix]|uniref:Uncharacterized protein n=1 Tax=Streblomastix strix TaxID=222440 RepID=A0A5J4WQB9_9EUKA|nr:MAG: hypothetical protein EZS28_007397 [Streblomastix strix]